MSDRSRGIAGEPPEPETRGPGAPEATAVVVAAGRSSRMGGVDKLFASLGGRPLLYHTLAAFEDCAPITHIMLVLSEDSAEPALDLLRSTRLSKVDATCLGGVRRQDSVRAAVQAVRACDWLVVHDAARPLVTPELIEAGILAAQETGAASAAVPVTDTLKEAASDGTILWTVSRERLWAVQTPQVFRYHLLLAAHEQGGTEATDDAGLVERLGVRVRLFAGSRQNLKVTTPEDLGIAEALLQLRRGRAVA
jgi:2-C-methyl-D-erythritol 4-phosphate cytidylyltransferase